MRSLRSEEGQVRRAGLLRLPIVQSEQIGRLSGPLVQFQQRGYLEIWRCSSLVAACCRSPSVRFSWLGAPLRVTRAALHRPTSMPAQKAGKPILVEITAPWCPTCKAQAPILGELREQPKFKELRVFAVDFDNQKDVVKSLKAQNQSTFIVFKGGQEVGRSVGDTKRESIEALLTKAL